MAVTNISRSLREGSLVIKDGTTPTSQSLVLRIDEGDLSWVVRSRTVPILGRGTVNGGHVRKGIEEPMAVSFSARWTQLVGKSVNSADALQLYELLMFVSGANVVSTSPAGQQETLRFEFTLNDPSGVAGEKVTFGKVFRESLTLSEGSKYNQIHFSGHCFETQPMIERI